MNSKSRLFHCAIVTYLIMNFYFFFSSLIAIYSGLNFQDLMVRLGAIDSPPKTPAILGFECAGEVEAVGEGVEDFKVGFVSLRECSKDKRQ